MSPRTLTRSSVLILTAAAAVSLSACGNKDNAAARKGTSSSTANVTPPLSASNTDRSAAPGAAATPATAGSTAATGNSTDTAGSASATSTIGTTTK